MYLIDLLLISSQQAQFIHHNCCRKVSYRMPWEFVIHVKIYLVTLFALWTPASYRSRWPRPPRPWVWGYVDSITLGSRVWYCN